MQREVRFGLALTTQPNLTYLTCEELLVHTLD